MPKSKQTLLPILNVSKERREQLHIKLRELYNEVRNRFNDFGKFQDVVAHGITVTSNHLKNNQNPEEMAVESLIKPLIGFLGYQYTSLTNIQTPSGDKKPDIIMMNPKDNTPLFYVEAEQFNKDLYGHKEGIAQVNSWLLSKTSKSSYGIATDGFIWVVLKFEESQSKAVPIHKVDLKRVFTFLVHKEKDIWGNEALKEVAEIEDSFLYLDSQTVNQSLEKTIEYLEDEKEEISKNFYNDYVKYVFGKDKNGNQIDGTYLIKEVIPPEKIVKDQSNLFSVVLMNRLIFIKFLEENKIVSKTLLNDLWKNYLGSSSGSFYGYLKTLFYEVLNTSKDKRIAKVANDPHYRKVPYLNGGLFRPIIEREKDYSVSDEGISLVLNSFFVNYKFGSNQQINADMLGYIFEKTINYISGQGKQKEKGAYYTPDDIVGFIIDKTLTPVIFEKIKEGLRKCKWREEDINQYSSLESLLSDEDNRPKNPIIIRKIIESINAIRVLDPACGSGHFLTAMLPTLLRVKETLLRSIDAKVDRYRLKKEIITNNIYGVDLDENAVEIARLRLWLSLIEEINPNHVEPLPNIDFNIVSGNSLIGWLNEHLGTHPLNELLQDPTVVASLESIASTHPKEVTEVKKYLDKKNLNDTIKAYEELIRIYSSESGESAVKIREAIAQMRIKLYELYTNSYINFIHENSNLRKLDIGKFEDLVSTLKIRNPFHWKVDYGAVFENNGFDVVVGNPPYIEDGKYNQQELKVIESHVARNDNGVWNYTDEPLIYLSNQCGNTHAYFIERSIEVLKDGGKFGFIVPVALVSTERMNSIREILHSKSSSVSYFNFDDRPSKIFRGIQHCRSTIVITEKGTGVQKVTTSKFQKWKAEDRPELLKKLETLQLED